MSSFALSVQRLSSASDRTLVLAQIAGYRNGDGWFDARDVALLFEAFKLRTPANISRELSRLASADRVTRRPSTPRWALQPEGQSAVGELMGGPLDHALLLLEAGSSGAQLGHGLHTLIPPSLAPAPWQRAIQSMLSEFDFDSNVFCMTRFPGEVQDGLPDPVANAIDITRSSLAAHGLHLHMASDRQLVDDLYGNVAAHMWACRYGVALFEDVATPPKGLNHNLVIEVGSMLMTGRRCALLKDPSAPSMPTDFVGQIYKDVELGNADQVSEAIHKWSRNDLGLGHCGECP